MNGNNRMPAMPGINNAGALARLEAETGSLARKVLYLEECLQGAFQHIGALQEQMAHVFAGMTNADRQMPGLFLPPKSEESPTVPATTQQEADASKE